MAKQVLDNQKSTEKISASLAHDKNESAAFIRFSNAIKTKSTLDAYTRGLDQFMILNRLSHYNDIKKFSMAQIDEMLEKFVISLNKKKLKFSSCNMYLSALSQCFVLCQLLACL